MSRRSAGARLYVRERPNRQPIYVILDGTREISTGCGVDDVTGANKALKDYLTSTFRPDTGQRDLAQIFCGEVLMMYARDLPANSPSRATIGYHVANLAPFWGEKPLAAIKGSTCREYVKSRPVKASTARQELKTLQAAIGHWHRESPLAAIPQVTLPDPGQKRERVLERWEVAAMLRACRKLSRTPTHSPRGAQVFRDYSYVARFILIGVYTGTRHDAILNLGWNASLSGGHIDLERGIMFRRGSAERETSKRRPPVQLPQQLRRRMARWRKMDGEDILYVVNINGARIAKMKKAWANVVKTAGLGKDVTPHVLRHTCASWQLWEGKTMFEVAGIIGADASTVEKVYGHQRQTPAQEKRRA